MSCATFTGTSLLCGVGTTFEVMYRVRIQGKGTRTREDGVDRLEDVMFCLMP